MVDASRCSGSQSRQIALPRRRRFSGASRAASKRESPDEQEEKQSRFSKLWVPDVALERHLPPRECPDERLTERLPL